MQKFKPLWVPSILILLEIIHFLVRWLLLNSPFFSELDYDEGIIGLMALHILRGEPQLMLWGLPRMGGLEAHLASFLFYLFKPSALTIQLSLVAVSSVILMTVYALGKKVGGAKVGLIAAGYWAIPPIFLSFTGNYAGGGHLEAVLAGAIILYGICTFGFFSPSKTAVLWALIGVISGIGWWSSLLVMPFLVAVALGMVGTRPRSILSPLPWMGIGGYLLGSLPFWIWNYFHDFNTLSHLGGKSFLIVAQQLFIVFRSIIPTFIGIYWDGQGVVSSIPRTLVFIILIGFYLPILILSLVVVFQWLSRIWEKKLPLQTPLDYVVLFFWLFILVRASGETEDLGLTRYTLALYVPVSILASLWIVKIMNLHRVLGYGILAGLLGFNLLTNVLYLDQNKNRPVRPVDDLIKTFEELGIRYCYGDSRITQVITFESKEKIIGSDYYGWRNYDFLRAVDRAPVKEMAIVTHRKLGNPFPDTMESTLRLIGASFEKKEMGDYVFFYHFKKPDYALRSIPAGQWKVTSSQEAGQCFMVKDRDILTAWRIPKRSGEWLQIDLGRSIKVGQISILPGPFDLNVPSQFKLEVSSNGQSWNTVREVKDYIPGLSWFQGRPRLNEDLRVQMIFPPQEGRYLRITTLGNKMDPDESWTIAEIFVYESSSETELIPEQAAKNLHQAQKDLDRWMDDPTGPQPSPLHISLSFRKKQVDWPDLIQSVSQAIREAPDWEEAHQLFGMAVQRGELWNKGGQQKKLNSLNFSTLFPANNLAKISSAHFKVSSNYNNAEAGLAIDGDPFTRWGSSKGQEPGMFFLIDLGDSLSIRGFSLFLAQSINDSPRILKILSSSDGENWKEIQATPNAEYAFEQNQIFKKVTYRFAPTQSHYLKLIQNGSDPVYWWSIYELEIFNGTL